MLILLRYTFFNLIEPGTLRIELGLYTGLT